MSKDMVKIVWLMFLSLIVWWGCHFSNETKMEVVLGNTLKTDRTEEVVEISWDRILEKNPDIDTSNFKVIGLPKGEEIPFQLEYHGAEQVKNLLVQVNIPAESEIKLGIVEGRPLNVFKRKAYGRFVPERYDDFAWENDKVAHRMYGKALESRPDNAFGIDVWVKRKSKLVIDEWYKHGDYHKDHGDGMDYYNVGATLGAGDIAPFLGDSVNYSKNFHHWKVLDNGPLRVSFQLGYDEWNAGGTLVKMTKTVSLDAGSRMNKIEAVYRFNGIDSLPIVVGIVKREGGGALMMDRRDKMMGYWEPEHGEDGSTGVGTFVQSMITGMSQDKTHFLTHASVINNKPFIYYNGSAWSKANEIKKASEWFDYLRSFRVRKLTPVKVKVQ